MGNIDVFYADGTVGRLAGMGQNPADGFAEGWEGGERDGGAARLGVEPRGAAWEVEEEVALQAELEDRVAEEQRVAQRAVRGLRLEVLLDRDLGGAERGGVGADGGRREVVAVFRGQEAVHVRLDAGVDEEFLGGDGGGCDGGDQGVLLAQGVG